MRATHTMKQDTMNLVLVNPQQINVSNPEIKSDYLVPSGWTKHDHFLYREDM